eukprot:717683_1
MNPELEIQASYPAYRPRRVNQANAPGWWDDVLGLLSDVKGYFLQYRKNIAYIGSAVLVVSFSFFIGHSGETTNDTIDQDYSSDALISPYARLFMFTPGFQTPKTHQIMLTWPQVAQNEKYQIIRWKLEGSQYQIDKTFAAESKSDSGSGDRVEWFVVWSPGDFL